MAFFFVLVSLLFAAYLRIISESYYLSRVPQVLLPFHLGTMVILIGLGVFYTIHIIKNSLLAPEKRALWVFLILMGNAVTMPIYWYFYIWSGDRSDELTRKR